MGTKYASESISGYNAAPPPDDASTGEDNRLRWSNVKDKVGDPIKTALENIDTKLVNMADEAIRDVSTGYAIVADDYNRTVRLATAGTVNLPDAASITAGFSATIFNAHTASITVGRTTGTDTINGTAADITLEPNEAATFDLYSTTGYIVKHKGLGDNINVSGTITAGGNITAFSDERLKHEVMTIPDALEKVMLIRGVTYYRDNRMFREMGVIAQEVERVAPEVVTDVRGLKAVAYGNLVGLLIEAIKELSDKVERLENDASR